MADADYTNEKWLPVVGHEGRYEVSDHGRVRSLDRMVPHGRSSGMRRHRGRVLKLGRKPAGYPTASIPVDGSRQVKVMYVHRLVLEAFVGPCPEGNVARHLDDDKSNNHLSNLVWGTESQNAYDKVRNGNDHYAKRSACKWGHEFTPENTKRNPRYPGTRYCKTCIRESARKRSAERAEYKRQWRAKRRAEGKQVT